MVGMRVDPVYFTVMGLVASIDTSLAFLFGTSSYQTRSFAIQGLGKVGWGLLSHVAKTAKRVYVTDLDPQKGKMAEREWKNVTFVSPEEIFTQEVDVFCPCALSHALTVARASMMHAQLILGAANCQLESSVVAEKLYGRGITYAPDYVVNGGGLIAVVDEYDHGKPSKTRITKKVQAIADVMESILHVSKRKKMSPASVADGVANKRIRKIM
jgi:leucine dehydrogenase